jgi:hypothetical protein
VFDVAHERLLKGIIIGLNLKFGVWAFNWVLNWLLLLVGHRHRDVAMVPINIISCRRQRP